MAGTPSLAHDRPLGDGKISSSPRANYLMSCQQSFNPNAPAAQRAGSWLAGSTYDPDKKPTVDGAVSWPSRVSVTREGNQRIVSANNLPTHTTGIFPIRSTDDAYRYDRNPGRISAQNILLRLPAVPQMASRPSCVPMGMIGFALTGVAIYNAVDARGRDAPAHEIQDKCGGHPQQRGQYHYHDRSPCLSDARNDIGGHSSLVGYALDGFGIYGRYGEGGRVLSNASLDACHGHTHTVMWDGKPTELYHYHMTDQYPYTIGCFRGSPTRGSGGGQDLNRVAQNGGPGRMEPRQQGRPDQLGQPPRRGLLGLFRPPPPPRQP